MTSRPVTGSTSATSYPGNGRPIDPGLSGWPGVLPICAVVSVCPKPSRIRMPSAASTCSMTSGLSGSPAPTISRSANVPAYAARSAWIIIRYTVGGAQKVVTRSSRTISSRAAASNRAWLTMRIVAAAFHGANRQDQACLAQPGEEMFRCTSPGRSPIQYIVARCPTG